ncbi:MAG: CoA-binding protein [Cyclobacteriaceae bacterium]
MSKKTIIVGASTNPSRYAYIAAERLTSHNHEIIPIGIKKGVVSGTEILDIKERPQVENVDTITLYIGPARQPAYYDYLISLKPKRIIFNPGTENEDLVKLAEKNNIETVYGCTLVMLSVGNY